MELFMLNPDEAKKIISETVVELPVENRALVEAVGFCCAADIHALNDSPGFDNSAMDGYAINSADIASPPFVLSLAPEIIAAGCSLNVELAAGMAVRIFTGAPLPPGVDTIVAQESVTKISDTQIRVNDTINKADFVRPKGSDLKKGTLLMKKGDILTAPYLAILASQGIYELPVYQRPAVGYLMTGNELCAAGQELKSGQIRSSNDYMLSALLQPLCRRVTDMGYAKDDPKDLRDAILRHESELDVILISGGASVGDYDYTKDVIIELGYEILFERIASRPGRPLVFARKGSKLLFGVPGNPVSTFVVYEQFIKRAILQMSGRMQKRKRILCKLVQPRKKSVDLELYLKGRIVLQDGSNFVDTNFNQNSGALANLAEADCLVFLPLGKSSFAAGEPVEVLPFNFGEQWN
jgi:molybdopterin molybdotransferase